ncbi:MAG: redox-regulated ATPase YchF [Candidatus Lokiarchaeota archaeon]|nr:redox-regulated ATPase YchF [Candidatus Lokiarchaeota archaeon]
MLIGIVGKPNAGKTTFLNATCLTSAKIGSYPFTTIKPNLGKAYVRKKCVCKELTVDDDPKNSLCIEGIRLIPIDLIDVAGLVPDAWKGKGLGNKFLNDLSRADALIHVIDASGSTNAEGKQVEPGTWDPLKDVKFLEHEINHWIDDIIKRDWAKFTRTLKAKKTSFIEQMTDRLSGLSIKRLHIIKALKDSKLNKDKAYDWTEDDIFKFSSSLRKISKPMIILANKIDQKTAVKNIERLKQLNDYKIIEGCALGEYWLRKYAKEDKIEYVPGDPDFKILKENEFNKNELNVLKNLKDLMNKYGSTGIQKALDAAVFDLLNMIVIYPVHNVSDYSDKKGNVLPDAFLVKEGTTIKEFAGIIHTDLEESFLHGLNARTKQRLGENYELKDCDIVKIESMKGI